MNIYSVFANVYIYIYYLPNVNNCNSATSSIFLKKFFSGIEPVT